MDLIASHISWNYAAWALTALLLAVLFPVTRHMKDPGVKKHYYGLQVLTLFGAIVGAKLAVLLGDFDWPFRPLDGWQTVVFSGRSITGGLIGGVLAAELGRSATGYRLPPNDRFAMVIPFSIGLGRIGCFLNGCCRGLPYNGPFAVAYDDGILRHPAQLYEAVFQLLTGLLLVRLVSKRILRGRIFNLYMILYGTYRFFSEFIRETPKFFAPYSAYQFISLAMIAVGAAFLVKRTVAPPVEWPAPEAA